MIYNFVLTFIVLNLVYELVEVTFPISKMRGAVKSFVLIVILSVFCGFIATILGV